MRLVGKVLAVGVIGLFALVVGATLADYDPRRPAPLAFLPEVRVEGDAVRVRNSTPRDWTDVLVTLNDTHRCTAPARIVAGGQITVDADDCGPGLPPVSRIVAVHVEAMIDGQPVAATHTPQ